MICDKCGSGVDNNDFYCPHCGNNLKGNHDHIQEYKPNNEDYYKKNTKNKKTLKIIFICVAIFFAISVVGEIIQRVTDKYYYVHEKWTCYDSSYGEKISFNINRKKVFIWNNTTGTYTIEKSDKKDHVGYKFFNVKLTPNKIKDSTFEEEFEFAVYPEYKGALLYGKDTIYSCTSK